MIRFLNVYYPTRTVMLAAVRGAHRRLAASCSRRSSSCLGIRRVHRRSTTSTASLKIAGVTALSLILSYYFDLYEPQIVSARKEIYFRILLVLGFDCFILSAVLFFFPDTATVAQDTSTSSDSSSSSPPSSLWRRAYEWIVGLELFRERVYVLGAGDYRAVHRRHHQRARRDIGMEVVDWEEVPGAACRTQSNLDRKP